MEREVNMKGKYALMLVCSFLLLCSGCAEDNKVVEDKAEHQPDFEKYIQSDVSEILKVNANCVFPTECQSGIGIKAELGDELLWDRKDNLAEIFLGSKVTEEETKDYGIQKEKRYYTANHEERLSVSTEGYLDYKKVDQYIYISNVLYADDKFDSYNGDVYLQKENHDFLSQKDAWENIRKFLDSIDVEVSEAYTCYVMDYASMEKEEASLYLQMQEQGEKTFQKKEEWTEADNCYYFKTYTMWNGYPVRPVYTGEGIDENNVVIVYDQNGILALQIDGYYSLEEKQEIVLHTPKEVVTKLQTFLENIISDNTYELQEICLCQKIVGIDAQKHEATIVPVWECRLLVKNSAFQDGYIQTLYFDAETLEQL